MHIVLTYFGFNVDKFVSVPLKDYKWNDFSQTDVEHFTNKHNVTVDIEELSISQRIKGLIRGARSNCT